MGCDGGTIPRRDELVKTKKKPEQKDKDAELAALWLFCALSQQLLQEPIVACHLGKLYSKMAVIEALLDKQNIAEEFKHIKSLKDVKTLNLTKNPEFKTEDKKEGAVDHRAAPYICPVLGLEMNGKHRFVAIWNCGCVFSERAFKEMKMDNCLKCTKPFNEDDIVILNGTMDNDLNLMKKRMEIRQKQNKVGKKQKIKKEPESTETLNPIPEPSTASIKRPATSTTAEYIKKRKTFNGSSLSKIGNVIASGRVTKSEELKKMSSDYSIAKDSKATDVYKSLFTSHKSEQEQGRAHWITYNPFYN